MKLSQIKQIIKEQLRQLNEEDEYIDIACCPEIAGCSCSAQIIGGVAQNCCQHYFASGGCCNPTGNDRISRGPREPMGHTMG